MSVLHARLLGELDFRDDTGGQIKLATRKSRALLAYLIAEGEKSHTRERLANLLWSDRQKVQARHSLTQALSGIRKLGSELGAELVLTDGDSVRLAGDDVVSADLILLRRHADQAPERAADQFGGPFLDGFVSGDSNFDDWAAGERAALHNKVCLILEAAAQSAADKEDHATARDRALLWTALEPFSEAAHREVMRRLAAVGENARAIQQFQACARILRDELGVEPSSQTKALLDEIRASSVELSKAPPEPRPITVPLPADSKLEPVPADILRNL